MDWLHIFFCAAPDGLDSESLVSYELQLAGVAAAGTQRLGQAQDLGPPWHHPPSASRWDAPPVILFITVFADASVSATAHSDCRLSSE